MNRQKQTDPSPEPSPLRLAALSRCRSGGSGRTGCSSFGSRKFFVVHAPHACSKAKGNTHELERTAKARGREKHSETFRRHFTYRLMVPMHDFPIEAFHAPWTRVQAVSLTSRFSGV